MSPVIGKYLVLAGLVLCGAGLIVYFFHDRLDWIGKLPGDVRIENERFRFYFPITTTIVASLLLSGILYLIRRFF